jgi:hypothetical protein
VERACTIAATTAAYHRVQTSSPLRRGRTKKSDNSEGVANFEGTLSFRNLKNISFSEKFYDNEGLMIPF